MIRKLLLITLLTAFSFAAGAKGLVSFGVKAGLTTQNLKFANGSDLSASSKTGYHFGLVSRVNLLLFHVQPEILYSHNAYDLSSAGGPASKVNLNTVDVPVLAGLRLLWFRLQAGPMFNVMSESSVADKADITYDKVTKPPVSYLLGVGLDLGKLNIDVRYNGQFKRAEQHIQLGQQPVESYKSRFNNWMFSVGVLF